MSLWKAYVENRPWEMRRCLHVVMHDKPGTLSVVQPLVMTTVREGSLITENNGILGDLHQETDDFLQAIVDAAWGVGIRPTGLDDHTNELKATRFHLEDMRLLAKVRKP